MRTLYLHIGAHRTATSSIQKYLWSNFEQLLGKGFLYPYGTRRHALLFSDLASGKRDADIVGIDLNKRADQKLHDIHSVVLSDEDLCMHKDLTFLVNLKKHFNVKIIFSLRRQDLWLESWYFQNIKWQWNPELAHISIESFFKKREIFHWSFYQSYIQFLEKLFGRENICLTVFERGQMEDGPIAAFCDLIGLKPDLKFHKPLSENSSVSPLVSELLRQLPLDKANPKFRANLERAAYALDEKRYSAQGNHREGSLILSHKQRQTVYNEHTKGNDWIAAEYFNRENLFFDPLPDENTKLSSMALPKDSQILMDEFVRPYIRELITICEEKLR